MSLSHSRLNHANPIESHTAMEVEYYRENQFQVASMQWYQSRFVGAWIRLTQEPNTPPAQTFTLVKCKNENLEHSHKGINFRLLRKPLSRRRCAPATIKKLAITDWGSCSCKVVIKRSRNYIERNSKLDHLANYEPNEKSGLGLLIVCNYFFHFIKTKTLFRFVNNSLSRLCRSFFAQATWSSSADNRAAATIIFFVCLQSISTSTTFDGTARDLCVFSKHFVPSFCSLARYGFQGEIIATKDVSDEKREEKTWARVA